MNLNRVIIGGRLTSDPESRALPNGGNVTNITVATNRTYKDRDGKKQEEVEFHSIVVFGKQADSVKDFLKKGSEVIVEGHIKTRSWDNKEGEKKYRTEIIAERVQFGARPKNAEAPKDETQETVATETEEI